MLSAALRDRGVQFGAAMLAVYVGLELSVGNWGFSYLVQTRALVPTAIGVMNAASVLGGAALPWLAGAVAQNPGIWVLLPFVMVLALAQLAIWRLITGGSHKMNGISILVDRLYAG
jgi:fucose permease